MQKQLLIRLVVPALVASLIAIIVSHGTSIVWIGIVCWILVYWLWTRGDGKSTTRPFWWTVLRRIMVLVAAALALIGGTLALAMGVALHYQQQEEEQLGIEKNKVRIEKNTVRIGMTIYDVLPLLHVYGIGHGMRYITASAVVDCDRVYCAPDEFRLVKPADGTFTLSGYWATERVSGNLTPSQARERVEKEQVLENLTEFQAAEVISQKMSDGYEWRWEYEFVNGMLTSTFRVTFGRDGRVNDISDVHVTDLRNHRA